MGYWHVGPPTFPRLFLPPSSPSLWASAAFEERSVASGSCSSRKEGKSLPESDPGRRNPTSSRFSSPREESWCGEQLPPPSSSFPSSLRRCRPPPCPSSSCTVEFPSPLLCSNKLGIIYDSIHPAHGLQLESWQGLGTSAPTMASPSSLNFSPIGPAPTATACTVARQLYLLIPIGVLSPDYHSCSLAMPLQTY